MLGHNAVRLHRLTSAKTALESATLEIERCLANPNYDYNGDIPAKLIQDALVLLKTKDNESISQNFITEQRFGD